MTAGTRRPIITGPLAAAYDFNEFVSHLEYSDIRARFGHPVDRAKLPALLAPKGKGYRPLGAWDRRSLVGTAVLARLSNSQFEIAVLVRSDLKRRRIGSALIQRALYEAASAGAGEVSAHVTSDNKAALALLRRTGFVPACGIAQEMIFVARPEASLSNLSAMLRCSRCMQNISIRGDCTDEFCSRTRDCFNNDGPENNAAAMAA